MRHLLLFVILAVAVAVAPAAGQTTLTGKWNLHLSIAGNENDAVCALTQDGSELGGTCTSQQGSAQLSGKVDGNKVAWSYKIDYNGSPLTLKYAGAVDADSKISGSVTVDEFGVEGQFTATPAK